MSPPATDALTFSPAPAPTPDRADSAPTATAEIQITSGDGNMEKEPFAYEQAIYSSVRQIMGVVAALNAASLYLRHKILLQWAEMMNAAGFVDWPSLETSMYQLLSSVIPIVAFAAVQISTPQRIPTSHRALMARFFLALGAMIIAVGVGNHTSREPMYIPSGLRMQLVDQADAVANFNRGSCQAWCQETPGAAPMLARGECGAVQESSVFGGVVHTVAVASWCKEAITQQNYRLEENKRLISPFTSLEGEARQSPMLWETVKWLSFLCLMALRLLPNIDKLDRLARFLPNLNNR